MNAQYFYLDADGVGVRGPFEESEIADLKKRGILGINALVCRAGTEDWQKLGSVPVFGAVPITVGSQTPVRATTSNPITATNTCAFGCLAIVLLSIFLSALQKCSVPVATTTISTPASTHDDGFVSPMGHVHPGTVLYLRGERMGPITWLEDKPSDFYLDHRMLHIVHIDFQGRPDQTDMASVLRLYRVRPDER